MKTRYSEKPWLTYQKYTNLYFKLVFMRATKFGDWYFFHI